MIVAVLAAVGLGLQKDIQHFDYGYVLLFASPLLCAYVDMLAYELSLNVQVIAKYIREYTGTDEEIIALQSYENFVENCRQGRLYLQYERFAQLAGNVILGISLPALAWARDDYATHIAQNKFTIVIPVLGLSAVVAFYIRFARETRRIRGYRAV